MANSEQKILALRIAAIAAFILMLVLFLASIWPSDSTKEDAQVTAPTTQAAAETTLPQAEATGETTATQTETTEAATEAETQAVTEATCTPETKPAETTAPAEEAPQVAYYPDGYPIFYQNDYPDTLYGAGTIATSGCSIVSLAMVADYLTGHTYTPVELAKWIGGHEINNMARLEYGSDLLHLPYRKATNWHDALAALKEGKVVIQLMNKDSYFTDSQHFIVLTGINEKGRITVHDPNKSNYDFWQLKDGFANGFTEGMVCAGYSGAWIYDPAGMTEEPYIYVPPEQPYVEPRYDFELTKEETTLLAKLIWVEAQGEPAEGQQAVAEVVLNRIASSKFPNTVKKVIYGDEQFPISLLDTAEPYQAQYEAIERALYGPYILEKNVCFYAVWSRADRLWGKIGGHYFWYE